MSVSSFLTRTTVGRFRRMQAAGEDPAIGRAQLPIHLFDLGHDLREHVGRRRVSVRLVDAKEIEFHIAV